jgi:hypothetical protein
MFSSEFLDKGEELQCGKIKCKLCSKWCVSWQGLYIHYKKKHRVNGNKPRKRLKPKKPEQKPLTLWDLRYGGKKLEF